MKERFKTPNAVFLMLFRKNDDKNEILLQLRQNTGYMNGFWDTAASGHIEKNESMTDAVIRETFEEIKIKVKKENLEFVNFSYNNFGDVIYGYTYFKANKYEGTPEIGEPEKCAELKWFDVNNLPKNIIPDRKKTIKNCLNKVYFDEFGWEN